MMTMLDRWNRLLDWMAERPPFHWEWAERRRDAMAERRLVEIFGPRASAEDVVAFFGRNGPTTQEESAV
jgi:hypothetical protein